MADDTTETTETEQKPKRGAAAAAKAKAGVDLVRLRLAQLVWLVCVLAALCWPSGRCSSPLEDSVNRTNDLVKFVLDAADRIDLGVFDRDNGVLGLRRQERRDQERPAATGASPRSCG